MSDHYTTEPVLMFVCPVDVCVCARAQPFTASSRPECPSALRVARGGHAPRPCQRTTVRPAQQNAPPSLPPPASPMRPPWDTATHPGPSNALPQWRRRAPRNPRIPRPPPNHRSARSRCPGPALRGPLHKTGTGGRAGGIGVWARPPSGVGPHPRHGGLRTGAAPPNSTRSEFSGDPMQPFRKRTPIASLRIHRLLLHRATGRISLWRCGGPSPVRMLAPPPPLRKHGRGPKSPGKTAVQRPPPP